jgi:hypothetical protein
MNTLDYLALVKAIFAEHGIVKDVSPATLLEDWRSFVTFCEVGYSFSIYEYDNDIECRNRIELILTSPELQQYPQLSEYAANVELVDRKFKDLLMAEVVVPGSFKWWKKGVLRCAGKELASDLYNCYGIVVSVID